VKKNIFASKMNAVKKMFVVLVMIILIASILLLILYRHKTGSAISPTSVVYQSDSLGINILDTTLTYNVYNYPEVKNPLTSFSVMKPGIIMLPLKGGIYMPNFNIWYLEPDKDPLLSVSADLTDNTLYYSKNSDDISYVMHAYKDENSTQVVITDTFIKGFYNVISTGNESYYVTGINTNGYHIWQREKDKLDLLFETHKPITAFAAINSDACLICYENNLILLKKGETPAPLANINQPADGIAVDSKGQIYISAGNVIYQLISENKFRPILTGVHGFLQYLDGHLYILWQEKSKVLALNFYAKDTAGINGSFETVKIGSQTWKTTNLNVDTFRNGDLIPVAKSKQEWFEASWKQHKPICCDYKFNSSNGTKYGKFYNWYAIHDARNLAPMGWHVPSYYEFCTLRDYLGGATLAAGKMESSELWYPPNKDANNSSGFSALPAGSFDDTYGFGVGSFCNFWTSSKTGDEFRAWSVTLDQKFDLNDVSKEVGFSIRCIKD
jgi:uncharacterized protein (TIGR02145 family)